MTVVELGGGATVPFKAQMSAFAIAFKAAAEPDGRAVIGLLHGDALDAMRCIALTPKMAAELHKCLGEALDQPVPSLPTLPGDGTARPRPS